MLGSSVLFENNYMQLVQSHLVQTINKAMIKHNLAIYIHSYRGFTSDDLLKVQPLVIIIFVAYRDFTSDIPLLSTIQSVNKHYLMELINNYTETLPLKIP